MTPGEVGTAPSWMQQVMIIYSILAQMVGRICIQPSEWDLWVKYEMRSGGAEEEEDTISAEGDATSAVTVTESPEIVSMERYRDRKNTLLSTRLFRTCAHEIWVQGEGWQDLSSRSKQEDFERLLTTSMNWLNSFWLAKQASTTSMECLETTPTPPGAGTGTWGLIDSIVRERRNK